MKKRNIIGASLVGNTLEFYDFSLYGIFSPILASTFFPKSNGTLLASLATFAVGFFMRPLGGIVFGYIGDRWGRKKALSLSILLMAIPTFIVGCLPSYESIGIAALVILIFCRLLQGFCAGGEYNGASIFLLEHLGHKKGGLAGALVSASGAVGGLIASMFGCFLLNPFMPSNGWRLAFLVGGGIGILGIYIRHKIAESPDFQALQQNKKIVEKPLWHCLKEFPQATLATLAMAATSGALSYTLVVYVNLYLLKVIGFVASSSLLFNSLGLLFYILLCPLLGIISDRIGHLKTMLMGVSGLIIGLYPIFLLLNQASILYIILAELLFCLFASMFIAPLNIVMNKLFPASVRFSGIGFSYGVGIALMGGTMPFICTYLIEKTGNIMMPAYYLILCALIGGISVLYLKLTQLSDQAVLREGMSE